MRGKSLSFCAIQSPLVEFFKCQPFPSLRNCYCSIAGSAHTDALWGQQRSGRRTSQGSLWCSPTKVLLGVAPLGYRLKLGAWLHTADPTLQLSRAPPVELGHAWLMGAALGIELLSSNWQGRFLDLESPSKPHPPPPNTLTHRF